MSGSTMFFCLVLAVNIQGLSGLGSGDGCWYDGEFHPVQSFFPSRDCRMRCHCPTPGEISCVELCPPDEALECRNGTTAGERRDPIFGSSGNRKCYCLTRFCKKDGCRVNNRFYRVNETFTRRKCSQRCRCGEDGRLRCQAACPKITCPRGQYLQTKINAPRVVLGGCSCPIQKCIQPTCKTPKDALKHGKWFITRDCRTKCRCKRHNTLQCEPLCSGQLAPPMCTRAEELRTAVKFFASKKCKCERKRCAAKGTKIKKTDY